jgi:hypothetical protein
MPTTSARRLTSLFKRSNGLVECPAQYINQRDYRATFQVQIVTFPSSDQFCDGSVRLNYPRHLIVRFRLQSAEVASRNERLVRGMSRSRGGRRRGRLWVGLGRRACPD